MTPARLARLPRPLRLGLAGLVITALAALAAVAAFAVVAWTHPRDESTFLRVVHESIVENGVPAFATVSDDALLAEGDRACGWMADQAPALWRRGGEWSLTARVAQYQDEVPAAPAAWDLGHLSSQSYRGIVVSSAWAELCGGTRTLRGTHNPLNRPPHD